MATEIEIRDREKLEEIAAAVNDALATDEEKTIHTTYCKCKDKADTIKHTDVKPLARIVTVPLEDWLIDKNVTAMRN